MKRFLRFAAYVAIFCCAIFGSQLQAHGFGESTLIKNSKVGWWNIGQIYRVPSSEKQKVLSYDMRTKRCVAATVKAAAESETNCYVKIGFDSSPNNEIRCTPIQEFYLPETKKWAPAYKLKVGDKLLSNCATPIAITNIEFVKKPLKIYALRIKKNHNYMVGRHNILTHNLTFAVPSLALTIFTTFGEGAAAGGTAGSWLGPIGCTLTAVAGGLVVTGGWLLFGNDRKRGSFDANFDAHSFGGYFNTHSEQSKSEEKGKASDEKPKTDEEKTNGGADSGEKSKEEPKQKPKTPNQEAEEKARELRYKPDKNPPFDTHGKPAFKKGERWISQDRDQHNGGYWKQYGKNGERIGTFDKDLNKIR